MNTHWDIIWSDGRKEIQLFDTTLRDWHQCPWAAIEKDSDYFEIVRWLDSIWFDICEVWFPSSSLHEQSRVNRVAQMCRDWEISTIVAGLSQMVDFQVEKTLEALKPLSRTWKWMYHLYFPIDPKLRAASIWDKTTDEQALADIERYWKMIQDMGLLWQFSLEWYSNIGRNDNLWIEMIITAIENGFTYINLPDTKGSEDPDSQEKEYYVETIKRHKEGIEKRFPTKKIVWSVHNHNDLWLAAQNSMNGVKKWTWISKIEWTINGIWERAWNADLIQIITRMKTTLSGQFNIDHIDASHLQRVSDMVSELMLPVQPNYPVIWANAMRHTSWWHTNAMLKDPTVYQPFDPNLAGWEISFVYWPNSWGNLAISILEKNWYDCPKEDKQELDQYLKSRMQESWRYKWITDKELIELYEEYRNSKTSHTQDKNSQNIRSILGMYKLEFDIIKDISEQSIIDLLRSGGFCLKNFEENGYGNIRTKKTDMGSWYTLVSEQYLKNRWPQQWIEYFQDSHHVWTTHYFDENNTKHNTCIFFVWAGIHEWRVIWKAYSKEEITQAIKKLINK